MLRDLGMIGSELLESVVEVGEVDQRDRGRGVALDLDRRVRDPPGAGDVRRRSPESKERERAEGPRQSIAEIGGLGETVRDLASVRLVDRPRRDHRVATGVHRVPPADVRARDVGITTSRGVPEALGLDEAVGLLPERDFAGRRIHPTVADDAVLGGSDAGEHRGLDAGGDRGQGRSHRPNAALLAGEGGDGRGVRTDQRGGETDQIDEGDATGHA